MGCLITGDLRRNTELLVIYRLRNLYLLRLILHIHRSLLLSGKYQQRYFLLRDLILCVWFVLIVSLIVFHCIIRSRI